MGEEEKLVGLYGLAGGRKADLAITGKRHVWTDVVEELGVVWLALG